MQIRVTPETVVWYREEFGLSPGDAIRFFARYGGESNLNPGFSIGVSVEQPINPAAQFERDGICFFVRDEDLWYFNGGDLLVNYDRIHDEMEFVVKPAIAN